MTLNYHDNLFANENVMTMAAMGDDSIIQTMEIEFDPTDSYIFFFSTSDTGLFKIDKKEKNSDPVKMDCMGLNSPTALSMSDRGYLQAAFSCGSIS